MAKLGAVTSFVTPASLLLCRQAYWCVDSEICLTENGASDNGSAGRVSGSGAVPAHRGSVVYKADDHRNDIAVGCANSGRRWPGLA
jgi:hypothetical protein